jgi:hypothetical protein
MAMFGVPAYNAALYDPNLYPDIPDRGAGIDLAKPTMARYSRPIVGYQNPEEPQFFPRPQDRLREFKGIPRKALIAGLIRSSANPMQEVYNVGPAQQMKLRSKVQESIMRSNRPPTQKQQTARMNMKRAQAYATRQLNGAKVSPQERGLLIRKYFDGLRNRPERPPRPANFPNY